MWYNNRNAAIVRLDRLIQRRKFGKGAISILRIWYNHTMCGENLTTKTVLQDLPGPLLAWYRANARDLPWRRTTDPYQIWVSEIMLQQTRVAAVLGYYARFLETFPTVEALAAAPEERLMKLWEGLGYYSRARNLQKAARIVAEQGGRFPDTYQDLLALPGVGDYTASAIASAAFGAGGGGLHRQRHCLRRLRPTGSGGGRQRAAGGHAADGLPGRYCRSQGKKGRAGTDPGRHAGG